MALSITILASEGLERHEGTAPIYALGRAVPLTLRFEATQAPLELDDPRTSQQTLLLLYSHPRRERILMELNPARMDAMGELTAVPSQAVVLQPGQPIDVTIDLAARCGDLCLTAGWFELRVQYGDVVSAPLVLGLELRPSSVPAFLELMLSPDTDPWIRGLAFRTLQPLPEGPDLVPAPAGETAAEAAARQADNRQRADAYLERFPERVQQPPLAEFFAEAELRDPPPPIE